MSTSETIGSLIAKAVDTVVVAGWPIRYVNSGMLGYRTFCGRAYEKVLEPGMHLCLPYLHDIHEIDSTIGTIKLNVHSLQIPHKNKYVTAEGSMLYRVFDPYTFITEMSDEDVEEVLSDFGSSILANEISWRYDALMKGEEERESALDDLVSRINPDINTNYGIDIDNVVIRTIMEHDKPFAVAGINSVAEIVRAA